MGRIIKALILGWIGKKIYDRTLGRSSADESEAETAPAKRTPRPKSAAARKSAPKRTTRKTSRAA